MPSIVQEDQEMLFGKKRRWEDSLDAGRHVHLQQIQAKMSRYVSYVIIQGLNRRLFNLAVHISVLTNSL
jgi:hypothetical protein